MSEANKYSIVSAGGSYLSSLKNRRDFTNGSVGYAKSIDFPACNYSLLF